MAPIALILGAGARVGAAVVAKFARSGYSVAFVSRSAKEGKTAEGTMGIKADLASPLSIPSVFATVKAEFGSAPSVVVYNAATIRAPADGSMFSISATDIINDFNVNSLSAYVAAQEAFKGWAGLPHGEPKVFIYTGNILNVKVVPAPMLMTLGVGKAASAYWIGTADGLNTDKGYRFYYADERNADGSMKSTALDGDAHAEFFFELAKAPAEVPWHATFVKGKGYVKF